jgi:hypothetical protein
MSAKSYVWSTMNSTDGPPKGVQLHKGAGQYRFYPFPHEGDVLSADVGLWNAASGKKHAFGIQWPDVEQIQSATTDGEGQLWTLIVTTTSNVAKTIDPATEVDLQLLPQLPGGFQEVGYDVIDRGGLSGLGNVGFTSADLQKIDSLSVSVNGNGLFPSFDQASKFATAVASLAPEHAPFFPVLIYARRAE